jgi:anaphase-promoting complex subunit 3
VCSVLSVYQQPAQGFHGCTSRAALQNIAPREATVYFQIGKIYKKLKRPDAALTNFCHAMDLKPTSTDQNLIKSAIEKLHVDDDDADDEI